MLLKNISIICQGFKRQGMEKHNQQRF